MAKTASEKDLCTLTLMFAYTSLCVIHMWVPENTRCLELEFVAVVSQPVWVIGCTGVSRVFGPKIFFTHELDHESA